MPTKFSQLEDKVDDIDKRLAMKEAADIEKFKTLFRSSRMQFWSIWGFALILLLTVVYGALGKQGFHAVTTAATQMTQKGIK